MLLVPVRGEKSEGVGGGGEEGREGGRSGGCEGGRWEGERKGGGREVEGRK